MRTVRKSRLALVVFVAIALAGTAAQAVRSAHGPIYPVSVFEIEYALDHPRQPAQADLLDLEVGLSSEGLSFVAPRPVDRTVRMRLSSLPPGASFSATAIQHITQSLVATLNRRGIQGVIVTVPEVDERTGADLRAPGDTVLRLRVWTGRISRVTTFADGDRFGGLTIGERTNHTAHQWIRERAPVQPGGLRGLLGVEALEDYAAQVSRQPGRRVDIELEAGPQTGTTDVNIRVIENKPWLVYAQYSNTGTEATTRNRERFGFVHNQFIGRDDRLRVDYTTGDFDAVHAVKGSYAAPFLVHRPRWRWRAAGRYSQFDASEVGSLDSRYEGQQAFGEADVIWNAYQRGELFVDVEAGARVHQMAVRNVQFESNAALGDDAEAIFLVPRAGISAERNTRTSSFLFDTHVDLGFTDEDEMDLRILGTPNADEEFVVLRWDGSLSFYLEPLLDRQAWEDPSTPESSTRAHEVALAFRGQWAFDDRLVPQYQAVAGGLFTVRGYEQASVARDNLFLGSGEYRLHIPRLFGLDSEPPEVPGMGEFRARPQYVYGNPDWDLVLRVFADAARLLASDATELADETDETLLSLGGGLELQLLRNLNIRFDVGHAFLGAGKTDAGDTRGHIMATLLY